MYQKSTILYNASNQKTIFYRSLLNTSLVTSP